MTKKLLILISALLISAMAVSAQTGGRGREKNPATKSEKSRAGASLVLKLGPSTTYLKNGLSVAEVMRLLGQPASVSERVEGPARTATYIFGRSEGRLLVAEFTNGVLVNSRTESYESLTRK